MKTSHRLTAWTLVLAAFALAAWFYPRLPDIVAVHWNAAGDVDGTMPRLWGAFITPLAMTGLVFGLEASIRFSPQGFRLEKARDAFGIVGITVLCMLLFIEFGQLSAARGEAVRIENFVIPGIGVLFIVTGNYFGKVPKNFFFGLRTPWTLASDEVWNRTHRFAGPVFVVAGLLLLLIIPLDLPEWLLFAIGLPAAGIPLTYSFVIYRRLEGFKGQGADE